MKKSFLTTLSFCFLSIFSILIVYSCQKDAILKDNNIVEKEKIEHRSIQVNSIDQLQDWFTGYLVENHGDQKATELLNKFEIRWDQQKIWNDSTIVVPCEQFIHLSAFGYTRLFLQHKSNGDAYGYFYSIIPTDQNAYNFDQYDAVNFEGRMVTFDILDGYKDFISYEDGEYTEYVVGEQVVHTRCPGCWPDWWKSEYTDNGGGGDDGLIWPWDNPDGAFETDCSQMVLCGQKCPNNKPRYNCCHPWESPCNGDDPDWDITIINIPSRPGGAIQTNSTGGSGNGANGGSGGSGAGTSFPGRNGKNPVDKDGLDEIKQQQFQDLLCDYVERTNSNYDCTELWNMVDIDCLDAADFDDCVDDSIAEAEGSGLAECIESLNNFSDTFGVSFSIRDRAAIINSNPPCSDPSDFADFVLDFLFRTEFSKDKGVNEIDLETLFEDCFGVPDSNGNYIDCANSANSTFELTLYADQPDEGTRNPYKGFPGIDLEVGHAFLSLSMNNSLESKTSVFGFYPSRLVNINNEGAAMQINDDGGHSYSSSATIQLSCDDFNSVLSNSLSASSNNYNLSDYNCTDYAIEVANSVNMNVSDTSSPWVFHGKTYGNSSNPGDLGEDIKSIPNATINSSGGTATQTNCN